MAGAIALGVSSIALADDSTLRGGIMFGDAVDDVIEKESLGIKNKEDKVNAQNGECSLHSNEWEVVGYNGQVNCKR